MQRLPELRRRLQQRYDVCPDVIFDCRMFKNPAYTDHIGEHGKIFHNIVRSREFPEFIDYVGWWLELLKEKTTLSLVMLCKSGRHRSVACARIVWYLLRNNYYMPRTAACAPCEEHMASQYVPWRLQLLQECPRTCSKE